MNTFIPALLDLLNQPGASGTTHGACIEKEAERKRAFQTDRAAARTCFWGGEHFSVPSEVSGCFDRGRSDTAAPSSTTDRGSESIGRQPWPSSFYVNMWGKLAPLVTSIPPTYPGVQATVLRARMQRRTGPLPCPLCKTVNIGNQPFAVANPNGVHSDSVAEVEILSPQLRRDFLKGKDVSCSTLLIPGYNPDGDLCHM